MTKGILMKAPDLFTVDEQLEIQERLKSNDIEVTFLRDDQIQASFYSFIEILVNNDFLNELEIALCVDIFLKIAAFFLQSQNLLDNNLSLQYTLYQPGYR